jgi:hypothetical protein
VGCAHRKPLWLVGTAHPTSGIVADSINSPRARLGVEFILRNLRRLPRVLPTLSLLFYPGDLNCFDEKQRG